MLGAGTVLRGVGLRPEAVGPALGLPGTALRNLTVAADDVFGARRARRFAEPSYLDRWVREIERDPRVVAALHLLGDHPVGEVADQLAISSRHLQRVLLEAVGIGPKAFQQVMRFQRFVTAADEGTSLSAAAANAGICRPTAPEPRRQAFRRTHPRRFRGRTAR